MQNMIIIIISIDIASGSFITLELKVKCVNYGMLCYALHILANCCL